MKRSALRYRILAADRPSGYKVLAGFLAQLESGAIAQTAVTEQLARAFEQIIEKDADPARALNLVRERGKRSHRSNSMNALRKRCGPVWDFIAAELDRSGGKRGAKSRALTDAAQHFGKDRRTIERQWRHFEPLYRSTKVMEVQTALVEAHFTPQELEQLGDAPWSAIVSEAKARRDRKTALK